MCFYCCGVGFFSGFVPCCFCLVVVFCLFVGFVGVFWFFLFLSLLPSPEIHLQLSCSQQSVPLRPV